MQILSFMYLHTCVCVHRPMSRYIPVNLQSVTAVAAPAVAAWATLPTCKCNDCPKPPSPFHPQPEKILQNSPDLANVDPPSLHCSTGLFMFLP